MPRKCISKCFVLHSKINHNEVLICIMKNWFLQLSSRQKTNVVIITFFVSGLSFLLIPFTGISFVIWLASLVVLLKEIKLIRQQKRESNENNAKISVCSEQSNSIADVTEPEGTVEQPDPSPAFNFSFKTEYVEREPAGELSHLDFGKPAGELGCFLNYNVYKVFGIDESGKKRLRIRTGVDEAKVIETVEKEGFSAPFEVKIIAYDPPTEKQLEYLHNLGVIVPDGITKDDVSYIIDRVEDYEEDPSPELVALATGLKLGFSAFIGNESLFCKIVHTGNDRDRAALYAYAVSQSMKGRSFGNMLEDPGYQKYYVFADHVLMEPVLMRSLLDRTSDDFKKPYRGTSIYKAAAAFLTTIDK